jgi:carbon monoxide dehydrogenase subunit G
MSTIRINIDVSATPTQVWDVIRDVGAVHTRFAPGFVVDTTLEEGARLVKFANGMTVRELIVGSDEDLRRFAYSATGGTTQHHNASFEVTELPSGRTRIVWTADVLPEAAAKAVRGMMEAGSRVIQQTLDRLGQ